MNTFQNIKYFDKSGYEIPVLKASNIIIRTTTGNNDVIFNGVYNNKQDVAGNYIIDELQIVQKGSCLNEIVNELELSVFIDGNEIPNKCYLKNLTNDNFERFYFVNKAYTKKNNIANSENENIKYGISNINNVEISCVISPIHNLIFPSIAFTGKINIDRISTGLVENNSIFLAIENSDNFDTPFDDDYDLIFVTDENEKEIRFFTIDPITETVNWTNKILLDLSSEKISNELTDDLYVIDNNILPQVNIGFLAEQEGIYEQKIYVLIKHRISGEEFKIGEFDVTAEAIGEDERYRALFTNFGIPDPKTYPLLFKDANPDEDKVDWNLVNEKSKELFLTYNEIFPYVGTYKALINAVNFLGYNDIYFREWYKKIDTNKRVSYRIDVNDIFKDSDIKSHMGLNERILRKKLNELTMVYYINKETGETDQYNIPIIKNVYEYSIDEILVKLIALKEWLEKNIIALNCRIIDITGEGVVYERVDQNIYGMYMQNIEYENVLNVDATVINNTVELIDGSANIDITLFNNSKYKNLTLEDVKEYTFKDFIENNIFDNENNLVTEFGPTFDYPIVYNAYAKAYVDTSNAIIGYYGENDPNNFTNKPLFINDGEIYFSTKEKEAITYNILLIDDNGNEYITDDKVESYKIGQKEINFLTDKCPIIQLQHATLRTDEGDWFNNERFIINSTNKDYAYSITNLLDGNIKYSNDYIILYPMDPYILIDCDKIGIFNTTWDIYAKQINLKYSLKDNLIKIVIDNNSVFDAVEYIFNQIKINENNVKEYINEYLNYLKNNILGPSVKYTLNNSYNIPLFKIKGYKLALYNSNKKYVYDDFIDENSEFILEIRDGKMINKFSENSNKIVTLNFNYDNNENEQNVSVGIEYSGSFNYSYDINGDNIIIDPTISINVNNIGLYDIVIYAYDKEGSPHAYKIPDKVNVIADETKINLIYNKEISENSKLFRDENSKGAKLENIQELNYTDERYNNKYPIFKNAYRNTYLNYNTIGNENYIEYPNMSYIIDSPKYGDYIQLMNICDQFKYIGPDDNINNVFEFESIRSAPHNYFLADDVDYDYKYIPAKGFLSTDYNTNDDIDQTLISDEYGLYYYVRYIDEASLSDPDIYEKKIYKYIRVPDPSGNVLTNENTPDKVPIEITYKELCYCTVIFYDRLYNNAISEYEAVISKRTGYNTYLISLLGENLNDLIDNFKGELDNARDNNNVEIFIIPTGEHQISAIGFDPNDENVTALTLENYAKVYNHTSIFRKGDVIKIIYEVIKNKEVKVFIAGGLNKVYFEQLDDGKFYKDGDKTASSYVQYDEMTKRYFIINESTDTRTPIDGTIHTRYVDANDSPIYKGYTSFRIKSFDNATKTLLIDGKYNYYQKLSEFLLGYAQNATIDEEIKTLNDGFYIIRYQDEDGTFKNVKLRSIDNSESKYKTTELFTKVKIAHSHQAFVRYKMKVNDSKEYLNGFNKVFTNKNRLYDYLDGTFSFVTRKFDIENANRFWMNSYIIENNEYPKILSNSNLYNYKDPLTINKNEDIIIYATNNKMKDFKVYWNVYKQNITNKTRELLFEVINDKLYLNFPERGVYDIIANVYDNYGNLVKSEYEAFINVK